MEAVFTFKSTHEAIKSERVLQEGGVRVKVMALPSSLGAGCGLCLRVPLDMLDASRGLLAEAAVAPEGVYLKKTVNGKTTYAQAD